MNEHHLKRLFPNASTSFIKSNTDSHSQLCSAIKEQPEGLPLVKVGKAKKPVIRSTEERVKITFRIYSVRPCDWDNYYTKYIQDALVKSGVLHGDAWYELRGEVIAEKASSKDKERMEIEIEKIV